MRTWQKYLAAIVGAPVLVFALAIVALSVTTEQIGMGGKQVYTYDQATGFARMQVIVKDALYLLGGEHIGATEDEGYIRTVGGVSRTVTAMTGVTTNTTSASFTIPTGSKTPIGQVSGTGAVTATLKLYGDNDSTAANGILLCTITLSDTTKDVDVCTQFTADYPFYYATTENVTGTGATVEFVIQVGNVAGASVVGGGDATAANQATEIASLQVIDNIVSGTGANISQINGVAPLMGAGSTGTGSPRTTEASDSQLSADVAAIKTAAQLIDDDQTGASVNHHISVGVTEDETEIKATAGRLLGVEVTNTLATKVEFRCANLTAANTTPGTSAVFYGKSVPGQTTGGGIVTPFPPSGIAFSTALTCWVVLGDAETAVDEVGANKVTWNVWYK